MAAEQRKLRTTVHVHDEDGAVHVYGPGQSVPPEHAERIANPKAWDDWDDLSALPQRVALGIGQTVDDLTIATEPPRAGKGSGRDVWAEFAVVRGVEVDPGANRDDIIAACEAAGAAQPAQAEQSPQTETT